ncbi:hypothetical protein [Halobacillus campisalis]|uniref:hypothetical protein n=1 Tax=Halobacillus campisalis TaxID=435909 RepID=UPI0036F19CAB
MEISNYFFLTPVALDSNHTDVTGCQTGYVDQSGTTLATLAEREGMGVIVIRMKSEA